MNLAALRSLFLSHDCGKLFAKVLAENDNSKNQIYFGSGFDALHIFPIETIRAEHYLSADIFKASVRFWWLADDGSLSFAPGAQLILYPQYPEVRFSGFLRGCSNGPAELMRIRLANRVLFLGVNKDLGIIGFVVHPDSTIAVEFRALYSEPKPGIFFEIPLLAPEQVDSKKKLISELRRIHSLGWIDSKQLSADGTLNPCDAPQCGGFTLEAELRIPKNSRAEPDFLGWEVKQHQVTSFSRPEVGVITLMTPEPTGGIYKDEGAEAFIRRFGYDDMRGRADRKNVGGLHRVGQRHHNTHLTLKLSGFDVEKGKIRDSGGAIELVADSGQIAASWDFKGLLSHWIRKHAKAVYVPSLCLHEPRRRYSFGNIIRLAEHPDFIAFLKAFACGKAYYDPGLKLEYASTENACVKRRNQFRILNRDIRILYSSLEELDVLNYD
jgi:hypothetical protein